MILFPEEEEGEVLRTWVTYITNRLWKTNPAKFKAQSNVWIPGNYNGAMRNIPLMERSNLSLVEPAIQQCLVMAGLLLILKSC